MNLDRIRRLPNLWAIAGRHTAALIVICAGMLLRIAMVLMRSSGGSGGQLDTGEAGNVARAIATGQGFADPYFIGSGPTAHLMPTQPMLAGLVFKLLGVDTAASKMLLLFIALAEVGTAYFLLYLIGGKLGIARIARLMALMWLSFVPLFFTSEAGAFLFWEGGLAAALAMGCVYHAMRLADKESFGVRHDFQATFLAAITFFVSPTLGLAAIICYGWQYLSERRLQEIVRVIAVAPTMLALVFSPWVIRNYAQFDRLVPLRDNAGLELAIANHDAAVSGDRTDLTYWARLDAIHPLHPGPGQERVRRIGEIAYFDELQGEATSWIGHHPRQFGMLYLRHVGEMVLPPAWNFGDFKPALRAMVISIINLAGIAAIVVAFIRRRSRWIYPALFVLLVIAAYGPFQPVVRYYYPVYITLAMCAAYWPGVLARRWISGRPGGAGTQWREA